MGMTEDNLKESIFLVEATSTERFFLWKENVLDKEDNPLVKTWEQQSLGEYITLGYLDDMPVTVAFNWDRINGQLVTFYYPTSKVIDYRIIDDWLDKHFDKKWDYSRRARTDAMNFHQCLHAIKQRNEDINTLHGLARSLGVK